MKKNLFRYLLSWMLAVALLASCIPLGAMSASAAAPATYTDIAVNEAKSVSVSTRVGRYFRFIPEQSGIYRIYSYSLSGDAYVYLLDAEGNTISFDDDDEDLNFRLSNHLEAGVTYYINACAFGDSTATYTLKIEAEELVVSNDLTVAQAVALGLSMDHNCYTTDKYYVTGVITEVYNEVYGNMYLADAEGNVLTLYGTYNEDGTARYDQMDVKPVQGDTITVYGIVGQYNGTPQVKNGWIMSINPAVEGDVWDGTVASGFGGGSGTASSPYLIYTAEQLAYLASSVNAGNSYSGKYIQLMNNIDLADREWTPIGLGTEESAVAPFSGNFNGNFATVTNLMITGGWECAGLFGCVNGATIENLAVTDAYVDTYYHLDPMAAGVLCGFTHGSSTTLRKVYVDGSVRALSNKTENGRYVSVGLLVGAVESSTVNIYDCYGTGMVYGEMDADWNAYIGGLVGLFSGSIYRSYFNGTVTASGLNGSNAGGLVGAESDAGSVTISNSFALGTVTADGGNELAGGVYSYWDDRTITCTNVYHAVTCSPAGNSYGTTTSAGSFAAQSWITSNLGWDFDDTWTYTSGYNYPVLQGFDGFVGGTDPDPEPEPGCYHEYDVACDPDCNVCYERREVYHNVLHVEALEPTYDEYGNIEYWYCDVCGYAWLDEECKLNTNLLSVILPMLEEDDPEPDPGIENIYVNDPKTVSVSTREGRYFRFIPERSGTYTIYSYDKNGDPYVYLLNADMNTIDSDDDSDDNGTNFRLTAYLNAGETYYINACAYSDSIATYTFKVIVDGLDPEPEPEPEPPTGGAHSEYNSTTGDVFLGGNYIELGISKHGSFGTSTGPSSDAFYSDNSLSFRMDEDGWGIGDAPATGDCFLPGTSEERYILAYHYNGSQYEYAVNDRESVYSGSWRTAPTVRNASSGDRLKAIVSGVTTHGVAIEIIYSFGVNDKYFTTEFHVTNNGSLDITNLRFVRSMDPDQDYNTRSTYDTYNKVICNPTTSRPGGEDNCAIVVARGYTTGTPFYMVALDNRAQGSRGVEFSLSSAYLSGLWNATHSYPNAPTTGSLAYPGSGYTREDSNIAMTFNLGTLAAGTSTTGVYYSGLTTDITPSEPSGPSTPSEPGCYHEYDVTCDPDCNVCYGRREVYHNVLHVEALEPTYEEYGNIEYWYCDVCGYAWLDEECKLNTNLKSVILPMLEEDDLEPDPEIEDIYENDPKTVSVSTRVGRYFRFIPERSGNYTIYSYDKNGDPYVYLLDADMNTIDSDDDGDDNGTNFRLTAYLYAGETYYINACAFDDDTATYTFEVVYGSSYEPEPDPEITSGVTGDCTWTLEGTHLTISGYGAMGNYYPYSGSTPWGTGITSVTIEEGVTNVGDSAFYGCDLLPSIALPSSVIEIGYATFANCSMLGEVDMPESVISIGAGAYESCYSLSDVYYGGSRVDRDSISIEENNGYLLNATWHYSEMDIEDLYLNDPRTVSVSTRVGRYFRFIPEHSGTYTIYSYDHIGDPYVYLLDADMYELGYDDDDDGSYNFRLTAYLYAGETYYINACAWNDSVANYTFQIVSGDGPSTPSEPDCYHEYDTECDPDCNLCGENREVEHSVIHVDAMESTCCESGNIEYWYCEMCGQAWLDAECTLNTNLRAVILPLEEHTYVNDYDPDCDVCGEIREVDITFGNLDGNGAINNQDLALLMRYICGWDVDIVVPAADVNHDGKINNKDLALLQRYINGWDVELN